MGIAIANRKHRCDFGAQRHGVMLVFHFQEIYMGGKAKFISFFSAICCKNTSDCGVLHNGAIGQPPDVHVNGAP